MGMFHGIGASGDPVSVLSADFIHWNVGFFFFAICVTLFGCKTHFTSLVLFLTDNAWARQIFAIYTYFFLAFRRKLSVQFF